MTSYIRADRKSLVYSTKREKMDRIKSRRIGDIRQSNDMIKRFAFDLNFIMSYVDIIDDEMPTIIYVGCCPGKHLTKIMELFKFFNFRLYDEVDMCPELEVYLVENAGRVEFYNYIPSPEELHTRYHKVNNRYFISCYTTLEIRNDPDFNALPTEELVKARRDFHLLKEDCTTNDTIKTMEMARATDAICSFLKFRPYHHKEGDEDRKYLHFDGTIILPIFSEDRSSECRIVVNKYGDENQIMWSSKNLSYHINDWNFNIRESLALNPFTKNPNPLPNQLGNNFEVCALFSLIRDYFESVGHVEASENDAYNLYSGFIIEPPVDDAHCM